MAAIKNMIYLGDIAEETVTVVDPDRSSHSVPFVRFNENLIANITSLKVLVNAEQNLNGYYFPWPSGGNWNRLLDDDYELGGIKKNSPVGSYWERVKSSVGEEEYYFRTKNIVYSIENKPFTIEFNSDVYSVGLCLFSDQRFLGESSGWIDFRSTSPYTFSTPNAGVSEFALVIKRKDGHVITEDDYKYVSPKYIQTRDSQKQSNKTYYVKSGTTEHPIYTIFIGDSFEAGVQYYEIQVPESYGVGVRYRIGGDSNICPIYGKTGLHLYHSDADVENPSVITDTWESTAGAIYGGIRSFIDGRLIKNKQLFVLTKSWIESNESKWKLISSGNYVILAINIPEIKNISVASSFMCTHLQQKKDFDIPEKSYMYRNFSEHEYNFEIWLDDTIRTIDDFKNWLNAQETNGLALSFVIDLPSEVVDLEPVTIVSYSGINIIWSDSGDIKEFVCHTTHDEIARSSLEEIYNDSIESVSMETSVSMIGDELFIDQFSPVVLYKVWHPYIMNPYDSGDTIKGFITSDGKVLCSRKNYNIQEIPYGSKITYFSGNRNSGEFFCKNVERIGETKYRINAMSAVGLMDRQYHVGGIYTGQLFSDVVFDILGPSYEYEIDAIVSKERVYGWLPYDTKRKNLHQLIMAYGVNITKNNDGKMFFVFLDPLDTPSEIEMNRIFSDGSVKYDEPASRIELTEHAYHYVSTVDEEVLFDNSVEDSADHSLITFDYPVYPQSVYVGSGSIEIHELGANHAVISGVGVLKGKPYTHTAKVIAENNSNVVDENIKKVENATLVTMMNSENVLLRLAQYYFNVTTINQAIEVIDEKPGQRYIMHNAFNEYTTGFITKMSTLVSSFRRADCEIIQHYIPTGQGAAYTNSLIVPLDSGAVVHWTIPSEVYEKDSHTVRVVLIGYGDDGYPGEPGEESKPASEYKIGLGGLGGLGGDGGSGGKIFSTTISVDGITEFILKNDGRNSVLNSVEYNYSSAFGVSSMTGYYDAYSGKVFALPGKNGLEGGNGGSGGQMKPHVVGIDAVDGSDVIDEDSTYYGGKASVNRTVSGASAGINGNITIYIAGGGGSGAVYGANGQDGYIGWEPNDHSKSVADWGKGGNGVDGAPGKDALTLDSEGYGNGGGGGNGGSGAGGPGLIYYYNEPYNYVPAIESAKISSGGLGGSGGKGAHGCAILYW